MKWSKLSAAGNDFIAMHMIDLSQFRSQYSGKRASAMCDRYFGLGADGVLATDGTSWVFLNADGSEAEFCGNGARALAVYESRLNLSEGSRHTRAGEVSYHLEANKRTVYSVRLEFSGQWITSKDEELKRFEHVIASLPQKEQVNANELRLVQAGVPHLCISLKKDPAYPPEFEWLAWARNAHQSLGKSDVNFTLFHRTGPAAAVAMTFERGVSGATLACGSGALAVSFAMNSKTCQVRMPGGELSIERGQTGVSLTGPVQWICDYAETQWSGS